jgi:hypothetical protein
MKLYKKMAKETNYFKLEQNQFCNTEKQIIQLNLKKPQ